MKLYVTGIISALAVATLTIGSLLPAQPSATRNVDAPMRLSDINLGFDLTRYEECNKTCVLCVEQHQHVSLVAPPSSPAGSGGPEHSNCMGDHTCDCVHDCEGSLSCLQLQAAVERAIELMRTASLQELHGFLKANRAAVAVNHARSAIQFLGCRDGEIIAHVPIDEEALLLLSGASL
jgi:hypothetical protein